MIELTHGDILQADAEALVNTVNCVGFMGRGIALQFKNRFPQNNREYEAACQRRQLEPGRMLVHETKEFTNPKYIINFPTKRHWRGASRIGDIEDGLKALVEVIRKYEIHSIAIPPLGCGLGGLDWSDVRPRIERALGGLSGVRILIYEPAGAPVADKMARPSKVPNMTEGRAALIKLMQIYLAGLMDPFISLLEIHKLMYFLQEAGQPLKLAYVKAPYGPYAENMRHVLKAIEGYFISGYGDGCDDPTKQLEIVPGAEKDADDVLGKKPQTLARMQRVARLVEGFETPFGLELLSTVHWVSRQEGVGNREALIERVYAWNERKRQFALEQIEIARDVLSKQGWLA